LFKTMMEWFPETLSFKKFPKEGVQVAK